MLTEAVNRKLEPKSTRYSKADSEGLSIEVTPSGARSWKLSYRFNGA
ncbi:hypothetical protein Salmuc_04244 [Salipiger mucosus DSM 16094]|uniref:Integrase DNA-binding domain-containing protein n=1 Tax=Salipiger mucosus DSM 16094 TaxID=1123237 RepID=S9QGF7_9RHOB|nr:hypothetical protein Salmuc_04244 [Salipiger mucosus DSM 16094]